MGKVQEIRRENRVLVFISLYTDSSVAQMQKLDLLTQLVFTGRFAWSNPEAVFALLL
jgi:hypothetical protein